MAVIHISQEEAERDFASVLKRLDANTSFVIENGATAVAKVEPTFVPRTIEEAIALLEANPRAVMDDSFARDVQDSIDRHREPPDLSILE